MTRRRRPWEPRRRKIETTKLLLGAVVSTYFVGLGVGIYAVLAILREYPEYSIQALVALLSYIGTPVITVMGLYIWKAKAENINKHHPKATLDQIRDLLIGG